jgi:phosphohistidine swiveling domain-containing protein
MPLFAPAMLAQGAQRKPLPFGLFSVLSFGQTPEDNDHWQGGGVTWEYLKPADIAALGAPDATDGSPATGVPLTFDMDSGNWVATATPFSAVGWFKVSPVAYDQEAANAKALQMLTSFEQKQVEEQFWTGNAGNEPNLTTGTTALTAAATIDALPELEDYIANTYGSLGCIHMSRKRASILMQTQVLMPTGSVLATRLGTPVVAGAGYADDRMVATPALFGLRGGVFFTNRTDMPTIDARQNDLYAVAERTYLIGFDPTGVGSVAVTG